MRVGVGGGEYGMGWNRRGGQRLNQKFGFTPVDAIYLMKLDRTSDNGPSRVTQHFNGPSQ